MSTIVCKFCGKETETQYHEYCHFFNVYNFGGEDEDRAAIEAHKKSPEYRSSQMYHDVTLQAIKNISVNANMFEYNENVTGFEKKGETSLFDADLDGTRCSEGIVKSNKWIAHFDRSTDVTVDYTFEGKKKSVVAQISPPAKEGLWYLGIHINNDFKLDISLCIVPVGKTGISESVPLATVDLDLSV